ncbi:hypothetical protein CDV36_016119, partial [Fusarium kuroshium]
RSASLLSYQSIALSYVPRPDGIVLRKSPNVLIAERSYAAVPMINGVQVDEGTLFTLFQSNLTTTTNLKPFMRELPFQNIKDSILDNLIATYASGHPLWRHHLHPEPVGLPQYYVNFVHNLNPNKGVEGKYPNWPQWDQTAQLINFEADKSMLINDDSRSENYQVIANSHGEFNF